MRFFSYSSSLSTAAAALSEAESAGLMAGAFQVSAKAAFAQADEQDVPFSSGKAPFSFGPSTARFLFGKTKRKWGVESVPRARRRETRLPWGPPLPGVGVVAEAQEVVGGHAAVLTDQGDLLRRSRSLPVLNFTDGIFGST